jgi:dGTP triphosphohydrolase
MKKLIISLLLFALISCKFFKETETTTDGLSCAVQKTKRKECGSFGINQQKCEEKGCCWKVDFLAPWCFKAIGASDFNDSSSEATSTAGKKIDEILEKKIEEIKKQIEEGKTDFNKMEEEIIKSFKNASSKMQERFKEANKVIKDFLKNHILSDEEAKAVHRR